MYTLHRTMLTSVKETSSGLSLFYKKIHELANFVKLFRRQSQPSHKNTIFYVINTHRNTQIKNNVLNTSL